jgi:polyferredoxin
LNLQQRIALVVGFVAMVLLVMVLLVVLAKPYHYRPSALWDNGWEWKFALMMFVAVLATGAIFFAVAERRK